ncbi:MAG TPA: FtsH protease activity modulator HflK [Bryobacteraceae bacterium]|nr:FtsH protease activity modulator HflK [Bryobacteraceae bacterium]
MSSIAEPREIAPPMPDGEAAEPGQRWTPRRIAAAIALAWLATGVFAVRPDEQAVVTRFGAVVEPRVYPGIHYALPWPIDRAVKVKVNQLQRVVIGGEAADRVLGRSEPLAAQFLTGDQNVINLRAVVQFSVGVPVDYLFHSVDVGQLVAAAAEAELARRVAARGVDAVLTTERIAIQDEVLGAAQVRLNEYGAGVKLSTVNIEIASPPPEAADAFRDVAGARADAARIIDEAHGYTNGLIPRARGEAVQLAQSAEAYRQTKVNQSLGDAARFTAIAAEYEKAADVTGQRLYLETMEQVLPKIRKLIVDSAGNVDLSIIGKSEAKP